MKDEAIRAFDRLVYAARRKLEERERQSIPWGYLDPDRQRWARKEKP